jgi:cell division protein FtsW (lipid II flippase)
MSRLSLEYWRTLLAPRGRSLGRPRSSIEWRQLVAKVAIFAILAWICMWWEAVIGEFAPPTKLALQELTVTVVRDRPVEIGWRDLGQRPGDSSAEQRHIRLDLSGDRLFMRNIAHSRRLSMKFQAGTERFETFGERLEIVRNYTSQLWLDSDASLTFENVTPTSFELKIQQKNAVPTNYRYKRGEREPGETGDECARPPLWRSVAHELRERAINLVDQVETSALSSIGRLISADTEVDVYLLGGERNCSEPWRKQISGIGELGWHSLKIVRNGDTFMIAPFDTAARYKQQPRLTVTDNTQTGIPRTVARGFQEASWQIDEKGPHGRLTQIVAGKTTYNTTIKKLPGDRMEVHFTPVSNVTLLASTDCQQDSKRCPHPYDLANDQTRPGPDPSGSRCTVDGTLCWAWAPQDNPLASDSLQQKLIHSTERAWRVIAALAALTLAGVLSGGPIIAVQRLLPSLRARAARRPYRTLQPLMLTLVSVVIALASTWLPLLGIPVAPHTALQLTLANWLLAGVILLWGASGILLGLMWIAITVLAALGTINLAAMVSDGDTTRWLSFFVKHKVLFLDFVPPLVIAAASCPLQALRPVLHGFVSGGNGWARLIRFLPAILLLLLFLAWFLVGRQTGFGVFQPVEAGKFAMVLLAATVLMSFDPRIRVGSIGMTLVSSTVSLVSIIVFGAVLLLVPLLRSDWSPFLIMTLLFAGVVVSFGAIAMLRGMFAQLDAHHQRQQVPRVFKPAFSRWWWFKHSGIYLAAVVATLVTCGWFLLGSPVATAFTNVAGVTNWADEPNKRLIALESEGLASARRVVIERIITWVDMDYRRNSSASCALDQGQSATDADRTATPVCYVDLEWQLLRSRRIIAAAPCGLAGFMVAGPKIANWAPTLGRMSDSIPRAALGLVGRVPDCGISFASNTGETPDSLKRELRPIDIPVVESDFAGAYLIGRLGAGAGFLLYAAQILLIVVVVVGTVRVVWAPSGGHLDEAVRRNIAIVMVGAAWLLILQWGFSWSNLLGLLPVMGQPMTWISYATSHHLFVAVPCVLVFVIGLRYAGMDSYRYTPRVPPHRTASRWTIW